MDSNKPADRVERFLAMMNLYLNSKWCYTHNVCKEWAADLGALFALRNILEIVKAEAANARRGEKSDVDRQLDVLLTHQNYESVREAIALAEKTPCTPEKKNPKMVLAPYKSADAKFYAAPVIRDYVAHNVIPRAIGNDPVVGLGTAHALPGRMATTPQQKQQPQQPREQPHDPGADLYSAACGGSV